MTPDDTNPRVPTVVSFALLAILAVGIAGMAFAGGAAAQSAGNFQVTIDSTNSPVDEGETLEVQVTIENTGDQSDTQTINLTIGGQVRDSTDVTLGGGNSTTKTLTWQTQDGDGGDYTAEVASENDSDTTDVTVNGPAVFSVTINSTNSPVTENDTLSVEVIIENTGDQRDFQDITLETDNQQRDSTGVALDPGAKVKETLTWETGPNDAGTYTANVSSKDDFSTRQVTVNDQSEFDVVIDSTNEPVREGNTLEVTATVENNDTASDTQDIELVTDGKVRDTKSLTIGAGNSKNVTLEWATETGDAGDYTANVSSETDTESTEVTVNAPPTAAFTRSPNSPNVNQAVDFEADASDPDGSIESYTWQVDGENVSASDTFSYTFTEAGDHEVILFVTDDDGATAIATRTITVNAPPEVSIQDVDATVGEEATIRADVSDDGAISTYEWAVDGQVVSTEETLTYTFEEGGTHQVTLRVTDDNGATTATTKSISVAGGATPTPTLHDPTVTATATASPSQEDGAGFGAAVALLALLATAFLARRR